MREIDTWIDWSVLRKLLDWIFGSKGLARNRCKPANEPRERPAAITAEYAVNKVGRANHENHATEAHAKKTSAIQGPVVELTNMLNYYTWDPRLNAQTLDYLRNLCLGSI